MDYLSLNSNADCDTDGQSDVGCNLIVATAFNTSTTFIDSDGFPFIYEKTIWCKLKYYKIRKIERKGIASILWLHGVTTRHIIARPPHGEMKWAGVIHYNDDPWLLYEYAEEKLKDSKRKV